MDEMDVKKGGRKSSPRRKTEIVDAALQIIVNEGAREFTAQRIARELDITSGALFRHYPSMNHILDAVIDRVEVHLDTLAQWGTTDPIARIQESFDAYAQLIEHSPEVLLLLLHSSFLAPVGSKTAIRCENLKKRVRDVIAESVSQALYQGHLRAGMTTEAATLLVLGALDQLLQQRKPSDSRSDLEERANAVWRAVNIILVQDEARASEDSTPDEGAVPGTPHPTGIEEEALESDGEAGFPGWGGEPDFID